MYIKQKRKEDVVICYINGEISIDTVCKLKEVFKKLIDDKSRKILLNFNDLDYIDSSGLASLIELSRNLKDIHGLVFLSNLSPKVRPIFGITKLDRIFKIYDTEGEAFKDLYEKESLL